MDCQLLLRLDGEQPLCRQLVVLQNFPARVAPCLLGKFKINKSIDFCNFFHFLDDVLMARCNAMACRNLWFEESFLNYCFGLEC